MNEIETKIYGSESGLSYEVTFSGSYEEYKKLKEFCKMITDGRTATNGDMIKAMFPNVVNSNLDLVTAFNNAKYWWNAPYKREVEDEQITLYNANKESEEK